jgi:starch synthase
MPLYKTIEGVKFNLQKLNDNISYCVIEENIKAYFINNPEFFDRNGLYGDKNGDYSDNLDRFAYFCRRALYLLKDIDFKPDIIHCHDWQTSLIPVYLKTIYAVDHFYKKIRTLLTIHNIGYQGIFLKDEFIKLGLDWNLFDVEGLEFYGKINLLKGGIVFSDIINTVSPTYAKETLTSEFGFGLEGVLGNRRNSYFGILNGLDYNIWNPETDKFIIKNFSLDSRKGKALDKEDLQSLCGLPKNKDVPLLGIVSRLAQQKGFDIISESMEAMCKLGIQLVILGTGDLKYHNIFTSLAKKYPKKLSLSLKFDDVLAHKIYAGSDIFLMPSRYEPCGLGQMIALRYGTIPLVFKTGGLADTINSKNGFVFDNYSNTELLRTIEQAAVSFADKKKWDSLVSFAMNSNFSWEASAKKYIKLYEQKKAK